MTFVNFLRLSHAKLKPVQAAKTKIQGCCQCQWQLGDTTITAYRHIQVEGQHNIFSGTSLLIPYSSRPAFPLYHFVDISLHLWGSYPLFAGSYGCTDLRCGFSEICDTSAKVWPASRTQTDFLNVSYIVWNDSNLSCHAINLQHSGLQLHVLSYSNRRPNCPKITDSWSS